MILFMQLLIFGHVHKWKLYREEGKNYTDEDRIVERTVRVFLLQCEKCGDFKAREVG
jgi:hypothetical protein